MTCASCGMAAHVLVGGKCAGCWFDENDGSTPTVRRIDPSPVPDQRAVA